MLKTKIAKLTLVTLFPFSFLAFAQANNTEGLSAPITNDPNAFDEKNFSLDLAAYLGAKQTQEFKELSPDNKKIFQDNFTKILIAQGIKTTVNNKQVDTLELFKPLMRNFVTSLASTDYAGTKPQQKYQNLMQERNKLFTQSVYLPKEVESAFANLKLATELTAKTITTCDANGSGNIVGVHERICASKIELEHSKMIGKQLDQSIADGEKRITELTNDIRKNLE